MWSVENPLCFHDYFWWLRLISLEFYTCLAHSHDFVLKKTKLSVWNVNWVHAVPLQVSGLPPIALGLNPDLDVDDQNQVFS